MTFNPQKHWQGAAAPAGGYTISQVKCITKVQHAGIMENKDTGVGLIS